MSTERIRALWSIVLIAAQVFLALSGAPALSDLEDQSSLDPRAPIAIRGNGDLKSENGVTVRSGTGADPHIIENHLINCSASSGFLVENTTEHIVIRNCWAFDGGPANPGIFLRNASNITISSCRINSSRYGIFIDHCAILEVADVNCTDNTVGIVINSSFLCNVSGCGLNGNLDSGSRLVNSTVCVIRDTLITYNHNGVELVSSRENTIERCEIRLNAHHGISLGPGSQGVSRDNRICNNSVHGNSYGLHGASTIQNTIADNNMSSNLNGIYLTDLEGYDNCSDNSLVRNIVNGTGRNGIYLLSGCRNNGIFYNYVCGNHLHGINISQASGGRLVGNTICGNRKSGLLVWKSRGLLIEGNTAGSNLEDGIRILRSATCEVRGNKIEFDYYGIYLLGSKEALVDGNDCINCDRSIYLYEDQGTRVRNNTVIRSYIGISISRSNNTTLLLNNVSYCNQGITLETSTGPVIIGNRAWNNDHNDLTLFHCKYGRAEKNELSGNGLEVWGDDVTYWNTHRIGNNTVAGGPLGFFSDLEGGNISEDYSQIILANCTGVNVRDQNISGRTYSIGLGYCVDCTVDSCTLVGGRQGLLLHGTRGTMVRGNTFLNNRIGLLISYGKDELIHNNFFDNDVDQDTYECIDIRWNRTLTKGPNILGGPYLGGNHWAKYPGEDLDGDGIGDTAVPYPPGDRLPLVYDLVDPKVTDLTEGVPGCGEPFTIRAGVVDLWGKVDVNLEYWFGLTAHLNTTMGEGPEGTWSAVVHPPIDSVDPLYYVVSAEDPSGNTGGYGPEVIGVVDRVDPVMTDISVPSEANIYEEVPIRLNVTDNIMVEEVEFTFNGTSKDPIDGAFILTGGIYRYTLPAQDRPGVAELEIRALDARGNVERRSFFIDMVDNVDPEVRIEGPTEGSFLRGEVPVTAVVNDAGSGIERAVLTASSVKGSRRLNMTVKGSSTSIPLNTTLFDDGLYTLHVEAFDLYDNANSDLINVYFDNTPPVADAGADIEVPMGARVVLDAGNSTDGMAISTYEWFDITGGQSNLLGSGRTIVAALSSTPGVRTVLLLVTDTAGNRDTDAIEITIAGTEPEPVSTPVLISTSPENGSRGVALDTLVMLAFQGVVNRTLIESLIMVSPAVEFTLFWTEEVVLVVDFKGKLSSSTSYRVIIDTPLVDPMGRNVSSFELFFTTADPPSAGGDDDDRGDPLITAAVIMVVVVILVLPLFLLLGKRNEVKEE